MLQRFERQLSISYCKLLNNFFSSWMLCGLLMNTSRSKSFQRQWTQVGTMSRPGKWTTSTYYSSIKLVRQKVQISCGAVALCTVWLETVSSTVYYSVFPLEHFLDTCPRTWQERSIFLQSGSYCWLSLRNYFIERVK